MSLPSSDHWERIHHVAIHVSDLEAAERRYCELFGMSVAFREGYDGESYHELPRKGTLVYRRLGS
jgi:catechol 2,3-dioxygenase-like lactoylglutathione lyase family enzyme